MQITPKILWTANPIETAQRHAGAVVGVPSVLVSGLEPPALAAWFQGAPWAAGVPLVLFCAAELVGEASAFVAGHERRRSGGSGVVSALFLGGPEPFSTIVGPAHLLPNGGPWRDGTRGERLGSVSRTVAAAVEVGRRVRGEGGDRHVAWELAADRSAGAIAVGLAVALGRAVAVAGGGPGPIFISATHRHGVDVVGDMVALEGGA